MTRSTHGSNRVDRAAGRVGWLLAGVKRLLVAGRMAGPRVHDARIAAICRYHGVDELWSADRDFGRSPDLDVLDPLLRAE